MTRTNRLARLAKIAAGGASLAFAAPLWAQSAQTAPATMPQSSPGADFAQPALAKEPAASVPQAYRRAPADAYAGTADAPNGPPPSTAAAEEGAPVHGSPVYGSYAYGPYYIVPFDRELWLEECRARTRRDRGDGPILGGLLGAITGGVIGNRAWDSERAIGTVLGAGGGGLLGAAIGGAIDSRSRRQRFDCEAYLDRYLAAVSQQAPHAPRGPYAAPAPWPQASGAHGAPYHGHPQPYPAPPYGSYTYAQPVMMVAVREEIPQRAVVREQVEEEWVAPPLSPASREIPAKQTAPPPAKGKLIPIKP